MTMVGQDDPSPHFPGGVDSFWEEGGVGEGLVHIDADISTCLTKANSSSGEG